jgi:hypothetical protein
MSKDAEEERVKMLVRIVLLILIAVPFAISVNGADVGNYGSEPGCTSNASIMAHKIQIAETGITNSNHDFTFSLYLTPNGECSACHNIREGVPYMWARNLTAEENYFNQTSNPNYIRSPTLYCYDCHDNHNTVDDDPGYLFFINESLGRYIPQDVAFDGDMKGNDLSYDSSPVWIL